MCANWCIGVDACCLYMCAVERMRVYVCVSYACMFVRVCVHVRACFVRVGVRMYVVCACVPSICLRVRVHTYMSVSMKIAERVRVCVRARASLFVCVRVIMGVRAHASIRVNEHSHVHGLLLLLTVRHPYDPHASIQSTCGICKSVIGRNTKRIQCSSTHDTDCVICPLSYMLHKLTSWRFFPITLSGVSRHTRPTSYFRLSFDW